MMSDKVFASCCAVGVIIAIAMFVFGIWLAANETKQWNAFQVTHHCKVIGHMAGDVIVTTVVGNNGTVSTGMSATADKTGWLCDDGVTYWR